MSIFSKGFFDRKSRPVGNIAFDINTAYKTYEQRYAAANSVIRTSAYGRGGLISVEPSSTIEGHVEFVIKSTGARASTLEEASTEVMRAGFADFRTFGGENLLPGSVRKANRLLDPFRAPEALLERVAKSLGEFDEQTLSRLRRAGVNVTTENINQLRMSLGTFSSSKAREIATRIAELRDRGEMMGIEMLDDEGGRILGFELGGQRLTGYQSNLLLSLTGNSRLDASQLLRAMESGDVKGVTKVIEKMSKREKAFMSPRELSLQDEELERVIGAFTKDNQFIKGRKLSDVTLITDPQYDLLRRYADGSYNFGGNKALKEYYKGVSTNKYFESIFENLDSKLTTTETKELKAAINSFTEGDKGKWLSDQLSDYLDTAFIKGDERKGTVVASLFKTIEQAFDGSDLLNSRFIASHISTLEKEKKTLTARLRSLSSSGSSSEAEQIKASLYELNQRIQQIKNGEMSYIVGRGRVGVSQLGDNIFKNIKTAFSAEYEFQGNYLKQFAMIISKHGLKGESGIGGSAESIIGTGIGRGGEIVYSDPVSNAFFPDILSDRNSIEAMRRHRDQILKEYRETIETGIIPEKIKVMLQKQAEMDISSLPVSKRTAGMRSKRFAEDAMRAINSGASVSDSPLLANMVHRSYAIMAFKEDSNAGGTFYKPALPDTHRFSIRTEASRLGTLKGKENAFKFGQAEGDLYGFEKISMKGEGGEIFEKAVGKFRIEGHKLFLPDHAAAIFHHSLGGFDLDDKGIARLVTYDAEGKTKRLGTYIFRQPSGPEELIFMRMNMDQETIRGMFGNTYFQDSMNEIISENIQSGQSDIGVLRLREFFDEESPLYKSSGQVDNADEIEQAIIRVRQRMIDKGIAQDLRIGAEGAARIAKSGSSSLMLRDIVQYGTDGSLTHLRPEYTKQGLYNIALEAGVFDMQDDVKKVLAETGLDESVIARINQASDFKEMIKIINASVPEQEASAIISQAISPAVLKRLSGEVDNLGTYVNRTIVAGAMLPQYEAFLQQAPAEVRNFLLDPKNIPFRMGIAPPESVIDPIKNLSGASMLHQRTKELIAEYGPRMDEEKLTGVLTKLLQPENLDKGLAINDLGQSIIESTGRVIGLARAVGSDNPDLIMGLDMPTLIERANAGDKLNLVRQLKYGAETAVSKGFVSGDALEQANKQIAAYENVLNNPSQEIVEDFLKKHIGLSARHKYATEALSRVVGDENFSMFNAIYRDSVSKIKDDVILGMSKFSSQEEAVATRILEKHKSMLEMAFGVSNKDLKDRAAMQVSQLQAVKEKLGFDIFRDIAEASNIKGITKSGLFDALDLATMPAGINLTDIAPLIDEVGNPIDPAGHQALVNMQNNRIIRRMTHYRMRDQSNAEAVMARLSPTGDAITTDSIARRASEILDGTDQVDGLARNTLLALSGRSREIESEIARSQAYAEAEIVKANANFRTLRESGFLNDMGTTDALLQEGTIDTIDDVADNSSFDRTLLDARNRSYGDLADEGEGAGKAIYKRISQKISGKEFDDIIKNPIARKGAVAAGALIVGSFLYQGLKGRSNDDVKGPPLLPGGSPYEEDLPSRSPQLPIAGGQGYQAGTSYQVSILGGRDKVNEFNQAAGNLVNGRINTTMYNSIPDTGRDRYGAFASSY